MCRESFPSLGRSRTAKDIVDFCKVYFWTYRAADFSLSSRFRLSNSISCKHVNTVDNNVYNRMSIEIVSNKISCVK